MYEGGREGRILDIMHGLGLFAIDPRIPTAPSGARRVFTDQAPVAPRGQRRGVYRVSHELLAESCY